MSDIFEVPDEDPSHRCGRCPIGVEVSLSNKDDDIGESKATK
jgi:hypothetical protein